MKALLVTNMWPTDENPALGIFVSDQVDALRRSGAEVDVFSFPHGGLLAYIKAAARLASQRRDRYDIVHAHFGLSAWVALGARAKIRAVTFHGTDLAHPRSRKLSLKALRFIDMPAAASEPLAASIPDGATTKRIEVLPCGVSMDRFQPMNKQAARAELNLPLDKRIILFPSDPARPEKHFDRAQKIAAAAGAILITLGGVPPAEVPIRISAADLVLIPSEREGFGLAVLEALACETPVISTPVGIAPSSTAGVQGAHAVEWDQAAWERLAESAFTEGMTIGGRKSASRWSSEACAGQVIGAWTRAIAASNNTRS
ncbi:MAG: glycosyltransferase [Actinomycetes bacterium]